MPGLSFLLIDAGNTRLKWAAADGHGRIRPVGEIATKEASPKWIRALVRKFSEEQIVLASVVPKVTGSFFRVSRKRLHIVTGERPVPGLEFDYPKPAQLGADRLAAAVAVKASGNYPSIIVACGTATAFTVLDAKGRLCGGAIAPGMGAQWTALMGATAQLPATALKEPKRYLGKSTQEAIRSGLILSFRGGVKEIIHQLSKELPGRSKPEIVVTGGNARYLAGDLGLPVTVRPLLVFEGLLIIGSRIFMPV